jgi:hypothetical protein
MRHVDTEQHQVAAAERRDVVTDEADPRASLDPRQFQLSVPVTLEAKAVDLESQEAERSLWVGNMLIPDSHEAIIARIES